MFKYARFSTIKFTHVTIHHSFSPDNNQWYDWYSIDKYHKVDKGWNEIGYHFGLELVNGVYRICLGRSLSMPGAHCVGMNERAIGICAVGNYDVMEPSCIQYWLLASLCRDLIRDFNIPIENIEPHSKYSPEKTCPGTKFSMDRLKEVVAGIHYAV